MVELACRAPSTHNSQPWHWQVSGALGTVVELYADRSRQRLDVDPEGRELLISCGAALHHARVAARALGWEPHVTRHPDPRAPDLLARIELEQTGGGADGVTRTTAARAELGALLRRCTDRRRFTSWPVDHDRLEVLCSVARSDGVDAAAVTDVVERLRVEHLVSRAHQVASATAPAPSTSDAADDHEVISTDGLLVLGGRADDDAAWLATGEALSAVWLRATAEGLSIVPLSAITEQPTTRASLRFDVLAERLVPHLLLRVGWQQIGRHPLGRTPRRPLAEVLDVEPAAALSTPA